jgi:hypothetical protein
VGKKVPIDPHIAELIDDDRKAQSARQQQVTQEGGFARTEEPGHHRDR